MVRRILGVLFALCAAGMIFSIGLKAAEIDNTEVVKELSPEERIEELMQSENKLLGGTVDDEYGNYQWVIDRDRNLLVVGTGNFGSGYSLPRTPWHRYRQYIYNVEIHSTGMTDARGLFEYCEELQSVDFSGFDTSEVTNMSLMFADCEELQSVNFSGCDTSKVTNMQSMFRDCSALESVDFSGFDTSSVTNMQGMFEDCWSLKTLDVSGFDVRNVEDMSGLFGYCLSLKNIDVSTWDTSSVKNINGMFSGCRVLKTLDLSNFDLRNVESMNNFCKECFSLTELKTPVNCKISAKLPAQAESDFWYSEDGEYFDTFPQNNAKSLTLYRTLKIAGGLIDKEYGKIVWMIDMDGKLTVSGTGDIWNPKGGFSIDTAPWYNYRDEIKSAEINVTGMKNGSYLFYECKNMEEIDLSGFDTSQMTSMHQMFCRCESLKKVDTSGFDTSNVTDMCSMFNSCYELTELDVSGFDTRKVTDMRGMFSGCRMLENLDVSGFDTAKVTSINNMFEECEKLEIIDVSNFNTSKVEDFNQMFRQCKSVKVLDVSGFDTSHISEEEFYGINEMFQGCESLETLNVNNFNLKNVTELTGLFEGCKNLKKIEFDKWDTSGIQNMERLFAGCESLKSLNVNSLRSGKVQNMEKMFMNCSGLETLDLSSFSTINVWNMKSMFEGCRNLKELNLKSFRVAGHFQGMFKDCESLQVLELKLFDTTGTEDLSDLFRNCKSLKTLDISHFKTENWKDTSGMFAGCSSLTELKLPSFYSTKIENVSSMFEGCKQLKSLELGQFYAWYIRDFSGMFKDCKSLKKLDISKWHPSGIDTTESMFAGCTSLTELKLFDSSYTIYEMSRMFENCSALKELDISRFYMEYFGSSSEFAVDNLLAGCDSLVKLTVPKYCNMEILLPKAKDTDQWYMYDGKAIDVLPKELEYVVTIAKNMIPDAPRVTNVFLDVSEGKWYVNAVQYVFNKGLMSGSDRRFKPTENITRAQLVTTLYRMAGSPEVSDYSACDLFLDVPEGKYYTDAVCWAYNEGIATGNAGKFDPTGKLTRQQMAAFFFRYAKVAGFDTETRGSLSSMVNADKVSGYATEAVEWAVGTGLISGSDVTDANGKKAKDLNPRGNTTRAQVATILQRFCEKYQ